MLQNERTVDMKNYPAFLCMKLNTATLELGRCTFKDKEQLGTNLWVAVNIEERGCNSVQIYNLIDSRKVSLHIQFYRKCADEFEQLFRVDNDYGSLHFHREGDGKHFSQHQEIAENVPLSQLVYNAFETSERIIRERFPDIKINEVRLSGALWDGRGINYQAFKAAM